MARRGGGDPRPGVPALALGALPGGADLPAPLVLDQPPDRLRAGQLGPRGQGEHEGRRDPQHVGLAVGLEELPQLGAAAVDLVPADEVERQAVGVGVRADVDGQLPLGAELQVQRQPHDQGPDRILDLLGGIHCRAPISACPVLSRTYDRCTVLIPFATRPAHPMYCRFTPAVASPAFSWPVSSIAPITSPPRRRLRRAASSRPAAANRRTWLIAANVSQAARFSSRCVRSGVRSPACCGDRPPVPLRHLADQRRHVPARLLPRLRPDETRPQQPQQLGPFPAAPARPLSWQQQPPSILLSSHTHDRQAAALIHPIPHAVPPGQAPMAAAVLVLQPHFVVIGLSLLVVAGSGAVLVSSAPAGPGPDGGVAGDDGDQVCQETADLADRDRDEAAARAFGAVAAVTDR